MSEAVFDNKTIPEVARDAALKWPGSPALRYHGDTVTFAEQYHRVCCMAQGLAALGIRRGDHVGVLISVRPEWFYLSYAISLLGAVIVPNNVTSAAANWTMCCAVRTSEPWSPWMSFAA